MKIVEQLNSRTVEKLKINYSTLQLFDFSTKDKNCEEQQCYVA